MDVIISKQQVLRISEGQLEFQSHSQIYILKLTDEKSLQ
jgi:hypothetical protein